MPPTTSATDKPQTSPAPDWNNVPFGVNCARCGHDLRGQAEPKCPACALEFDWRDACPIEQLTCAKCGYHLYGLRETRCPECGEVFDWRLTLLDYRRRQKDLFEYRWREQPVRSLVRTWRRAVTAKRFWQSIDIHDPPAVKPLLCMATLNSLVAISLTAFASATVSLIGYLMYGWSSNNFNPPADYIRLFWATLQIPAGSTILAVFIWWSATFSSLLILRQSMFRFRIRNGHVLRVAVYALTCTVVPALVILFIATSVMPHLA